MQELVNIPAPIITWSGAIIVALIGVYFSRKKTEAEAAEKITGASRFIIEEYEKRIERLEKDMDRMLYKNSKLSQRVSSVENDARIYSEMLRALEKQHEALQARMREWNEGIQILIAQIERNNSTPDWTPEGD